MNFGSSVLRSISELNKDSHPNQSVVFRHGTLGIGTSGSCGTASLLDSAARPHLLPALRIKPKSFSCAGPLPAYRVRAPGFALGVLARSPEFISVNGQCSVRSALGSDMRQSKRISGHAAATVPPHAPMNSPVRRYGGRVSFNHGSFIDVN